VSLGRIAIAVAVWLLVAPCLGEDAIAYRQTVERAAAAHLEALSGIVRGEAPAGADAAAHAQALVGLAAEMPRLYPAGSEGPGSQARREVWSQASAFAGAHNTYAQSAAAMLKAAQSGDAATLAPAFSTLALACKGCHDRFVRN